VSAYQSAHNAGCDLCRRQLADPQPFHDDLCCMNIYPGFDWDDETVIQCPHIAAPGPSKLCMGHLEAAATAYERIVARTAPFN
jgi:hypothetical protein